MKKLTLYLALFIVFLLTACSNSQNTENREVKSLSQEQAKEFIDNNDYIFVDLRTVDEYIGWPIDIQREGHIKGAVDFPEGWFSLIDTNKRFIEELHRRGIYNDKTLILYTRDGDVSDEVILKLTSLGYKDIAVLEGGIKEWAVHKDLPMEKLKNYKTYVYPQWIDDLRVGKKVANYDGRPFVILEVSYRQKPAGQIPGSLHIDDSLNHLRGERNFFKYKNIPLEVKSKFWNRPSDKKIQEILLGLGITKDTMVVLYGPNLLAANRCAAVMRYAGVEDIRILNGGSKRLVAENYPFVQGYASPKPAKDFGAKIPVNPEVLIDFEDEMEIMKSKEGVVASIRSWKEYVGEVTGYTYINDKGDIAEARFGYAGSDPYHMQDYRNVDNTMFNYKIIEERWNRWGITSEKEVAFHCGTGWRASEAYFYALSMGWKNIHVYDGGWYEWHMKKAPRKPLGVPVDAPETPVAMF